MKLSCLSPKSSGGYAETKTKNDGHGDEYLGTALLFNEPEPPQQPRSAEEALRLTREATVEEAERFAKA